MKKTFLILMIFVLSANLSLAQMFGNFTAYEGLEKAKETAVSKGTTNPILIGIGWMNLTQPMGPIGTLVGEIKLEGDDVGKANLWIYNFKSGGEEQQIISIGVARMNAMNDFYGMVLPEAYFDSYPGGEINLNNENDSPIFVKKLISTTNFSDKVLKNDEETQEIVFLLQAFNIGDVIESGLELSPEVTYWIACIHDNESEYENNMHCCYIKLSDLTTGGIICEGTSTVLENTESEDINIILAPNPASAELNINLLSDIQIDCIELFSVSGILIDKFESTARKLDISKLYAGSYYICFTSGMKKYYHSFVIVK